MKGWIGGLMVGMLLGGAVTGAAQMKGWETGITILNLPSDTTFTNFIYQTGYALGIDDALDTIIALAKSRADDGGYLKAMFSILREDALCLNLHARKTKKEFTQWATGLWRAAVDAGSGNDGAASILILNACK